MFVEPAPRLPTTAGPRHLARYLIVGELGRGGMGAVYQAYDPELARRLAIKVVDLPEHQALESTTTHNARPSKLLRDHLLAEARALARLAHPNVVPIFDVGFADDRLFLAMELIPGQSLKQWLNTTPPPSWLAVCDAMLAVARGLSTVHQAGLCHRDLKPENILFRSADQPVIIDFGLASTAIAVDQVGQVAGTPGYMAPEQYDGHEVGYASDIFALCVCWLEGLLARRLFKGPTLVDYRQEIAQVDLRGGATQAPAWLLRELQRGLAEDPRDRPAHVHELIVAIEHGLLHERGKTKRWLRSGAALSIVVACLGWPMLHHDPPERPAIVALARAVEQIGEADALAAAERGVMRTGLVDAAEVWGHLANALADRHRQAQDALEQIISNSAELNEPSLNCLTGHLAQLETLMNVLALADQQIARQAQGALASIGMASSCLREDRLLGHSSTLAPRDPQHATRVALARLEVQRIDLLIAAGAYVDAQRRGQALLADALTLDYAPLNAEIYDSLGRLEIYRTRANVAHAYVQRSLVQALSGGHQAIAAAAGSHLLYLDSFFLGGVDDLKVRLDESWAWVQRAGMPPAASAEWYRSQALFAMASQSPENCRHYLQAALDWEWRTPEPDSISRCMRLSDLGFCSTMLGDNDRAFQEFDRALSYGEATLGPNHPGLFAPLLNLAVTATTRGEYLRAQEYFRRSDRLFAAQVDAEDQRYWICGEVLRLALELDSYHLTDLSAIPCDAILSSPLHLGHSRYAINQAMLALRTARGGDRQVAHEQLKNVLRHQAELRSRMIADPNLDTSEHITWFLVALAVGDVEAAETLLAMTDAELLQREDFAGLHAQLAVLKGDWLAAYRQSLRAQHFIEHHPTTTFRPAALVPLLRIEAQALHHLGDDQRAAQALMAAHDASERGMGPRSPIVGKILLELALLDSIAPQQSLAWLQQAFAVLGQHRLAGFADDPRFRRRLASIDDANLTVSVGLRDWIVGLSDQRAPNRTPI